MGLRIQGSAAVLGSLRNLESSQELAGRALRRLATGLRIERASDDPAGLVGSEVLRAQRLSALEHIEANQRSMSVLRTAEAALGEIQDLLVGIREAAVLAAGGGALSSDQIEAEQAAVDEALAAIDRIASSSRFGRQSLVDGERSILAEVTTGITRLDVRAATFDPSGVRQLTLAVDRQAERAAVDVGLNAGGPLVLAISGKRGTSTLAFDGPVTQAGIAEAANRVADATGVIAVSGEFLSEDFGSDAFVRIRVVSGTGYSQPAEEFDRGADARASLAGRSVEADGLRLRFSGPEFSGDVYLHPAANGDQEIRITRRPGGIDLGAAEGDPRLTVSLARVGTTSLGSTGGDTLQSLGNGIPNNGGSNQGPGQGDGFLTLNAVPADLNGATGPASVFLVPTQGFTIDFSFDNSTDGDNIDGASLVVTADRGTGGGAIPAGTNFGGAFALNLAGDQGSASLTVGAGHAFQAGANTITASISDVNGALVAQRTYTFSVRAAGAADLPFEAGQDFRFVYDRDQLDIVANAGQPDGTVVTAGADGEADFLEDLRLYGLRGDTQAGADAILLAQVKAAVLARMNALYAGANISFSEGFMADAAGFGGSPAVPYGAAPGYSLIAVGGRPLSGGVLESDASAVIGRAQFDPAANSLENNDTSERLGVFTTRIFELERTFGTAAFLADFSPLSPALGGIPLGTHPLDDLDILVNGPMGVPARQARLDQINAAAGAFAANASAVLGHEVAHSLGLTPDGAPPKGYHGGSAFFPGSTSGHIRYTSDPGLVNLTNPGSSYSDRKSANLGFNALELAYLLQRQLYDPALQGGVAPSTSSAEASFGPPPVLDAGLAGMSLQTALAEGEESSLASIRSGGSASLAADPLAAITIVDHAIEQVLGLRSFLGGLEGDFLASLVDSQSEHAVRLEATESSIRDADLAREVGNLTRAALLSQAGANVVARSNLVPERVLRLLG